MSGSPNRLGGALMALVAVIAVYAAFIGTMIAVAFLIDTILGGLS